MTLNASKVKSNSKFKRPPTLSVGVYPARLVQILSLGLQAQRPYKGEAKDPKHEILTTYEFLDEFLLDEETGEELKDKPRWLSETFTFNSLDSDKAISTKRYVALDPTLEHEGDWTKLIGMPCMLTITNNRGKGDKSDIVYENIGGVSTMRDKEAAKAPALRNETKMFDIDEPDMEVWKLLPQWVQDKMKENLEFDGSPLDLAIQRLVDDDSSEEKEGTQKASQDVSDPKSNDSDEEVSW